MSQHDHEHMPDQAPKGADDQPNKNVTAAQHRGQQGRDIQPSAAGDSARHEGHADHAAAEASGSNQVATAPTDDDRTEQRDGQSSHTGMAHGGMDPMGMSANIPLAYHPTRAQIAAVSFLSVLALTAAVIFSASYTNLHLSVRDVGGAIMPPGMIMTYDTPGQSMRDMAAVDPRTVSYTAPADARRSAT